jgi:hypothetical protein
VGILLYWRQQDIAPLEKGDPAVTVVTFVALALGMLPAAVGGYFPGWYLRRGTGTEQLERRLSVALQGRQFSFSAISGAGFLVGILSGTLPIPLVLIGIGLIVTAATWPTVDRIRGMLDG